MFRLCEKLVDGSEDNKGGKSQIEIAEIKKRINTIIKVQE